MAQEDDFDYGSAPGTPKTPRSLERYNEKKKNGFKRLLSLTKKIPNLDKSPSASGRFENVIQKDEEGGSVSRRRGLSSIFKRGKSSKDDLLCLKDEGGSGPVTPTKDSVTPTKELQTEAFMNEDKKEKTKPVEKEKTQNLVETPKKLNGKERIEDSREESKPSKLNPPTAADAKEDDHKHPHKQTEDAKAESKEHDQVHEKSIGSALKEVIEHDHHQQKHHHIQTEDNKGYTKEQEVVDESEAVQEKSRDVDSPPPTLVNQEKEGVGCESIAEGLQKMCLPWTVNK